MRISGLLSTLTGDRSTNDAASERSSGIVPSEIPDQFVERLPLDGTETTVARESIRLMLERGTFPIAVDKEAVTERNGASDGSLRLSVDSFPVDGVSWNSYYLSTASVGVLFVSGKLLGVPYLSRLNVLLPIFVVFALLVCGALYQLYTRTNLVLFGLAGDAD